jgi:hypothetical protein
VSLPDQLERAGIVVGSTILSVLPGSVLVTALAAGGSPWWGPLVMLSPGFVIGWAIAADQTPFSYDDFWYVCLFGYLFTAATLGAADISVSDDGGLAVLAVGAAGFAAAAVGRYVWR